jgi:hypothetical protein
MERMMIKYCLQNPRITQKRKKNGRRVKHLKKMVQRIKIKLKLLQRINERRNLTRKRYNALIVKNIAILHMSANSINQRKVMRKQM